MIIMKNKFRNSSAAFLFVKKMTFEQITKDFKIKLNNGVQMPIFGFGTKKNTIDYTSLVFMDQR